MTIRIHATCVAIGGFSVLLRGPSGSGKSDLALRLIDSGGLLVADDQTELYVEDGVLFARAPEVLAGLIEVRGLGILRLPQFQPFSAVDLVVDLDAAPERLPEPATAEFLGVVVPRVVLAPFEPSAPAKVRLAVRLVTGDIISANG